ncbi:hypothetical protein FB451DRAFT_1172888 [Mycena latifolia]|nr:hypothetical protein FB451DRAFT_1172888 [Mycena latifolia]
MLPSEPHIPEQFALPRMLTDIDTSHTDPPPVLLVHPHLSVARLHRPIAHLHLPPHVPPASPHTSPYARHPESSLTPMESREAEEPSQLQVPRPSGANIHTVKSLFKELYPDLTEEEQETEYVNFRDVLNGLCARYLCASLALTHQDKDQVNKVYRKLTETFTWLAEYENHWPVAVCLQGKLHNSTARAVEKSTRKAINIIAGAAPARSARIVVKTRRGYRHTRLMPYPIAASKSGRRCSVRSSFDSRGGEGPVSCSRLPCPPSVNRWVSVDERQDPGGCTGVGGGRASRGAGRAPNTIPFCSGPKKVHKESFYKTVHPPRHYGHNRKPVAIQRSGLLRTCFLKKLRSRHYSTSHYAPRFASTPTNIEYSDPDVSRYPLVESNFSDAAHQPWIHDFNVQLQHGKKVSRFRIFMKRGKALNPNVCQHHRGTW